MTRYVTSLILVSILSLASGTNFADELQIPAAQLANLGIEFGKPEAVDLADDFRVPAIVRIPPTSDYSVVPIYSGTIKRLGVSTGDRVGKGDSIAWIASPDFHLLQSEYIDSYHQLHLSKIRFDNDETLHDEGIVSKRRLAESEHEMEDHHVAEQRLRHALNLAGMRGKEIDAMRQSLILQPEMILRAPVDGVVLDVYTTAGKQINPSQAVYRVADLSTLWLEIDVPFTKSRGIVPGRTVRVDQDQKTVSAKVTNIGSRVDENNQTIVVRAVLESDSGLAPGQFVAATLMKDGAQEFLMLPAGSVVRADDQNYVFVKRPDGVEVREIEVVRQARGLVTVGSGIDADEFVVVRGSAALKARWLGMGGGD